MDNSNKNRWMSVVALVVIGCLAFPVSGQSRTETRRITHGEWMVTLVADASGMLGMFFSRPVDPSNGSYSAFYLVRTGSDWETYGYSGASIGAAALRAEAQFNLGGKLQEINYLAKEIAASGYTSTSLPSTQYSILTNDFVSALHFAGVFKDAASFPARFVGTDGSASLGLFAKASIRPNCQEIDTPTLTPTIDVIAVFMNELVADYRSEKTYETRDGRYVATNGPMVAMLGGIISDCFGSSTICLPWGGWTVTPWTKSACTPVSFGQGANCYYERTHTRTRACTTTYVFCCIPWTYNFIEDDKRTDLDYCTIGQGCSSCPLIPPCSL